MTLFWFQGESEFYRRKIRTFHNIIDVNKDGVISFHDMELLMERFISLGNISSEQIHEVKDLIKVRGQILTLKSNHWQRNNLYFQSNIEININWFRHGFQQWWVKRWGEISPYTLITVEDYLEYMHHVLNDKELVRRAHSFIPYIFRVRNDINKLRKTVSNFLTYSFDPYV